MSYEPTQNEIGDKADELYQEALNNDDIIIDALINNLDYVRALLNSNLNELIDARLDLEVANMKHIYNFLSLNEKAEAMLIEEHGVTVRVDVDDYKFVPHDTRY